MPRRRVLGDRPTAVVVQPCNSTGRSCVNGPTGAGITVAAAALTLSPQAAGLLNPRARVTAEAAVAAVAEATAAAVRTEEDAKAHPINRGSRPAPQLNLPLPLPHLGKHSISLEGSLSTMVENLSSMVG